MKVIIRDIDEGRKGWFSRFLNRRKTEHNIDEVQPYPLKRKTPELVVNDGQRRRTVPTRENPYGSLEERQFKISENTASYTEARRYLEHKLGDEYTDDKMKELIGNGELSPYREGSRNLEDASFSTSELEKYVKDVREESYNSLKERLHPNRRFITYRKEKSEPEKLEKAVIDGKASPLYSFEQVIEKLGISKEEATKRLGKLIKSKELKSFHKKQEKRTWNNAYFSRKQIDSYIARGLPK